MQRVRGAVNAVYLIDSDCVATDASASASALRRELDAAQELLERVERGTTDGVACPSFAQLELDRAAQIQHEVDCALALCDSKHLQGMRDCALTDTTLEQVAVVIQRLREMEQSQTFHQRLLAAQRATSCASAYSLDNFAYGSTPFSTWLALMSTDSIQAAVADIQAASRHADPASSRKEYTVFGSSTGSLVLYAALVLGIECIGVEILPFLHDVASELRTELMYDQQQQQQQQQLRQQCVFVCGDMLDAPLDRTKILVLTSQCWDAPLHARVAHKLERELPVDALVVDYKRALEGSKCFALVEHLASVQVSWTQQQSLFVFKKIATCSGLEQAS